MKYTVINFKIPCDTTFFTWIFAVFIVAFSCNAPESDIEHKLSNTTNDNHHYVIGINLKDCVSCHANFWYLLNAFSDRLDSQSLTLVFNNERQVEIDAFINSTPLDISSFCTIKRDPAQIQQILSENAYEYFTTFLAVYNSNQELVYFKTLRGLDDMNSIPGMQTIKETNPK